MARKLLVMVALISLVLLVQASAGLATTYDLGQQGDYSNWTWKQIYSGGLPWEQGTKFVGGAPTLDSSQSAAIWKLGFYENNGAYQPFTNLNAGSHTETDSIHGTFTVFFQSTAANPNFFINIPNGPSISSNNTTFTYTATYLYQNGLYSILQGELTGSGNNSDANYTPFQFTAVLEDVYGDHQNDGYISSFTLTYPAASPTPIPGSVWLLGTGLLGLAGVGRRRKA